VAGRIVFLLKGYPRLSETFIAQEIRALEAQGLAIDIVSLRHPTDAHIHPIHREITARVSCHHQSISPRADARAALWARAKAPGYPPPGAGGSATPARSTPNRGRRFGQPACLPPNCGRCEPLACRHAGIGRLLHLMTGPPGAVRPARTSGPRPTGKNGRRSPARLDGHLYATVDHLRGVAGKENASKIPVRHGIDFDR
jgi:hypothetical protein